MKQLDENGEEYSKLFLKPLFCIFYSLFLAFLRDIRMGDFLNFEG